MENSSTITALTILDRKTIRLQRKREYKTQYLAIYENEEGEKKSWFDEIMILNKSMIEEFKKSKEKKIEEKPRKLPQKRPSKKISQDKENIKISFKIPISKKDDEIKKKRKTMIFGWKKTQMDQLEEAVHLVPVTSKDFWDRVAQHVDDKTAEECQQKYQYSVKSPTKKIQNKELVFTGIDDVKGKTSKKRAIRNILKHADTIQKDDLFESNFIESKKDMDTLEISFDESQYKASLPSTEIDLNESTEQIETNILKRVNMEDIDTYINKMKVGKRVVGQTKRKEPLGNKSIFANIGNEVTFNKKQEVDSEDDEILLDPFED